LFFFELVCLYNADIPLSEIIAVSLFPKLALLNNRRILVVLWNGNLGGMDILPIINISVAAGWPPYSYRFLDSATPK